MTAFLLVLPVVLVLLFALGLCRAAAAGDEVAERAWARWHEGNER